MVKSLFKFLVLASIFVGYCNYAYAELSRCEARTVKELKRYSSHALKIYKVNPANFMRWIRCSKLYSDLPTAAHEAIHLFASESGTYPVREGIAPQYLEDSRSYFKPAKILSSVVSKIGRRDHLMETYLIAQRGAESAATLFPVLLDEFNAYGNDLHISTDFYQKLNTGGATQSLRDGVPALMVFVSEYVAMARSRFPKAWKQLNKKDVSATISVLWEQSENALKRSCSKPRSMGLEDEGYLEYLCRSKNLAAITEVLGRSPVCPQSCLDQPRLSDRLSDRD